MAELEKVSSLDQETLEKVATDGGLDPAKYTSREALEQAVANTVSDEDLERSAEADDDESEDDE